MKSRSEQLQIGIVGACGRGARFKAACDAAGASVLAACDTNTDDLPAAAERLGAEQQYGDYEEMIDRADLDAVIIATPMPCHVPQSIAALERGLHVLSEVPAGIGVEECRGLVRAATCSDAVYMMAENYIYSRRNTMVREIVHRGLFGKPYYGEGEYLHELKELNEITRWRRSWQTGIDGVTYGTHSLGPLLQWMPGDRVAAVTCAGSGHNHRDPRGDLYENEASCVMLCRMRSGGLAKVRVDMLSERPHSMNHYQLQGTHGCYESPRAAGEKHRLWLGSRCDDPNQWLDLDTPALVEEFLPEYWKTGMEQAKRSGHGGGDFFEVLDFVDAALGCRPPSIGIHEAMDMTLPGLISQQSIAQDGAWLPVPDSRQWVHEPPARPQLRMVWPTSRRAPAVPALPAGYTLRQLAGDDAQQYIELLDKAGFSSWTHQRVRQTLATALPGGAFTVVDDRTGSLAATALAQHAHHEAHPHGGQLGWVAADPVHAGRGLGAVVTAAATRRLVEVGYDDVFLLTDDFRLPAIATYLKVGWQPVLEGAGIRARWDQVHARLKEGRK